MLSFFPRGVLDEILNLIESVSEGFPAYSYYALLPSGPLTSLFRWWPWSPKWPSTVGLVFRNEIYLKIFLSRTAWLRCLKFDR